MARYTGPKNKLARREGMDLGLKTVGSSAHNSLLRRINIAPGQHGAKSRRKISEFGLQLREKQRARRIYGILEKQFRQYFDHARKTRGSTGSMLLRFLEQRLDNVIYRIGLAPTRASARQLITHGHVCINNQKITIPSYQVRVDEMISLKSTSLDIPIVKKKLEEKDQLIPSWLIRKGPVGKVARLPEREDVDSNINEQLIVEYYSR